MRAPVPRAFAEISRATATVGAIVSLAIAGWAGHEGDHILSAATDSGVVQHYTHEQQQRDEHSQHLGDNISTLSEASKKLGEGLLMASALLLLNGVQFGRVAFRKKPAAATSGPTYSTHR